MESWSMTYLIFFIGMWICTSIDLKPRVTINITILNNNKHLSDEFSQEFI
jgi:hypothetical protein